MGFVYFAKCKFFGVLNTEYLFAGRNVMWAIEMKWAVSQLKMKKR